MLSVDVRVALPRLEVRAAFDVADGVLALVGPSGAGKTTILRAVAGLARPADGRVELDGRVLFDAAGVDLPPEQRAMGLVFQHYALFPHLSVARNVAFGLGGRRRAAHDPRVTRTLERFGIRHLADERTRSLSGGERQRVALARAVASGPKALLLDEPLSALDAATKGQVASELGEHLRALGLPAVLVSHDFADVVGLADRVAVMERGRIVQTATAGELLEAPASAFVAAFAGVNWFPGTASRRGHLTAVRTTDGAVLLSTEDAEGPVGAVVRPWDVALSTSLPQGSAMNALDGPVQRVAPVGNRARVTVGSHPPVVAEVTDESAERMGLAPGVRVVATWKATGTRLVPRPPSADDR